MYEAYSSECMSESCSTRAKLALGDLEIEGQTVPGLHTHIYIHIYVFILVFLTGNSPSSIRLTKTRQGQRKLDEETWN